MDDLLKVVVYVVAAANPARAALALRPPTPDQARPLTAWVAASYALVAVAAWLVAWVSGPVLDALEISPESFRVGGGIVIALGGARLAVAHPTVWPGLAPSWRTALVPAAFPALLAPELVAASLGFGADEGAGPVLVGALVAGAVGTLVHLAVRGAPGASAGAVCRLGGAAALVCGTALTIDGIFAL